MPNEFKVIIEIPLDEKLRAEISDAIKTTVVEKLAKVDFTKDRLSILPLSGGQGSTDGISVREIDR